MEPYYILLKDKMEDALHALGKSESMQSYATSAIQIISGTILELTKYLQRNRFGSAEEEINFYKHTAPVFYSKLIYFQRIRQIEVTRAGANIAMQKKYLQREYKKIGFFYCANTELFFYYATEMTDKDEMLFVGRKQQILEAKDDYAFLVDTKICPIATYKISKLKASKDLENYILSALHDIKTNSPVSVHLRPVLKWTTSKAAAVEVIYGLFVKKVFNDGSVKLKEIIAAFEQLFHVDLSGYHRIYYDLKMRKKDRTSFLTDTIHKLEEKMDEEEA